MNRPTIPFFTLEDIPKPEENPEFWQIVNAPAFQQCINFLIINEIRKYDPETMSDQSAVAQLAKLKGWQELLDLPNGINKKDEPIRMTDELPER